MVSVDVKPHVSFSLPPFRCERCVYLSKESPQKSRYRLGHVLSTAFCSRWTPGLQVIATCWSQYERDSRNTSRMLLSPPPSLILSTSRKVCERGLGYEEKRGKHGQIMPSPPPPRHTPPLTPPDHSHPGRNETGTL